MPDTPTSDSNSYEEKLQELENKLERLDERTQGKNSIELRAYDLSIQLRSESASMEKLAAIASEEMDTLTKRALIGEYQEMEADDMFSVIFGGDE